MTINDYASFREAWGIYCLAGQPQNQVKCEIGSLKKRVRTLVNTYRRYWKNPRNILASGN